ncbi:hypothetical protein PRIPAC_97814 [Pristionchus pacificus]|uniref:Serpentine receptor class gamma n=1 Tax=Pristionchus pacificus TaxID=54126 RepID=A0A2A6BC38_PRIPA|nr:hypothetical protein PRIPAC_97814 [Pristionchus pacificus]|eukprot:PDM63449.1 G protein-coupled receptor [Pristionchus pacificus]
MWSWLLILYTVYVPIFSCLWIVEMGFVLFYRKEFSSSYYFFFVLCGALSLINELVINFGTRLPLFPEVNSFFGTISWIQHGPFPTLLYAVGHFFGGAHETVNILTSINRATAIMIPQSHDKIWKYGIPISCVIVIIVGVAGSWHLFDSTAIFFPFLFDGEVYFTMFQGYNKHPEISDTRNAVIVALVSPSISVPLYAIAICFLRKKWKIKLIRTEFSLLLLGLSSVILSLPIAFHQLYAYIRGKSLTQNEIMTLYRMLPWLFDLRFFSPTVLVLITDSKMRRKLAALFVFRNKRSQFRHNRTVTTITSSVVRR